MQWVLDRAPKSKPFQGLLPKMKYGIENKKKKMYSYFYYLAIILGFVLLLFYKYILNNLILRIKPK